ncbi:MAG TPA: protease [Bacteroidales bacterium]|nr:protease [Bacteroidales bacterium]
MKKCFFLFSLLLLNLFAFSQIDSRLLRFPAVYNDQVVFSYAGDLYSVGISGGTARRITSHDGYEMFARFSPDGNTIAFTGQYDGNTEVYTVPSKGGEPKRLTYTATLNRDDVSDRMGPNNMVTTWTRDGKGILYRSRKQSFNDFVGQLFKVSTDGGLSEELPLPAGGFCSYSPDGKKLAYNQVMREFRTWKYYHGGMADDVWIYDFDTKKTINITDNDAQDIFPMWHEKDIYFISDRDRTMNLFVYNTESKTVKKVTNFDNYDIKFPSIGGDKIVFENGGYIYVYHIKTEKTEKMNIIISNDQVYSRNELKDASESINGSDVSPDGKRLVLSARGDIFTLPATEGVTRNLTQSSDAHDRNAVWSPDGKTIAYLSDASGEYEIYIQVQDGRSNPVKITSGADTYKYFLKWSPDSKKLLWSDKKMRLLYVDVDSKKVTEVAKSSMWEYNSFNWSPDSKWIAYDQNEPNQISKIYLYSIASGKSTPVTDNWYDSGQPVFSNDGKYLFFASNRDFNPTYSNIEWNFSYENMANIYFITLAKKTTNPLANKSDEVLDKQEKDKKPETPVDITVDLDGIGDRIVNMPLKASNYWNINMIDNKVYYLETGEGQPALKMFDLEKKKETKIGEIRSYTITADGKKMMLRKGKEFYIVDLPKAELKLAPEDKVNLGDMKVMVDKRKEWNQIYYESWRQMRDFFYDPGMHGVNWENIKKKYEVLLPYVNHRNDLTYIIGEMIAELNIGHAYVNSGEAPEPKRIKTGLLGAKISRDKSGYYKIDKILRGENWRNKAKSPLTEVGLDIKDGDYIFEIDGKSTKEMNDIYAALVGKAGSHIEIMTGSTPDPVSGKKSIIVPIEDEAELYYFNWVRDNIRKVNEATNGQVGYVHIPDMVTEGLNEFAKYFYTQLDKKALIIDDRGNGGGNISPMLVERLSRELTRRNMSRNATETGTTPQQMMTGPKILLINQYSASDGDLFPYAFKKHGLGKVIGVRSWGGVVGIRGSLPFIDGGDLRKPEFASFSSDGKEWIIEGWGVDPDVEVINDPAKEYAGEDEQLNMAIKMILEELQKNPNEKPKMPEFPDKTK